MEESNTLPFPYKFEYVSPEEQKVMSAIYKVPSLFGRLGPNGTIVTKDYMKDAANIYNMPLRSTDIFVGSYQRSGTTWTQELVWLLMNDFDYVTAAKIPLTKRYSFIDHFMLINIDRIDEVLKAGFDPSLDLQMIKSSLIATAQPSMRRLAAVPESTPRYIKTHLPMSLLNPKLLDTAKMLYVARDPRDVAVSCYHHAKLFMLMQFPGGFKQFWNLFYKDLSVLCPIIDHVKEAWALRHHPNMLFLFYEELSQDLPASISKVADFLGKSVNQEQMDRLREHLNIKNFKNNKSVNFQELRDLGMLADNESFVRKGKAGGWRDYFDEEMTQQAEQWIADNLRDTDLRYPDINTYSERNMEEKKSLPFPYEFERLKPEEKQLLENICKIPCDFVRLGPSGTIVTSTYMKDAVNIYNMPLRPTDIFVGSYQRSGTTWTQELVWLLANDLDYTTAANVPLVRRYPFIDMFMTIDIDRIDEVLERIYDPSIDKEKIKPFVMMMGTPVSGLLASIPESVPRFVKTHLPMSLLNPKLLDTAKMVYVARDPRDVAVSCFHHAQLFKLAQFKGGFKEFWDIFHKGLYVLCPIFEHVKEAWALRDHPNMLFLFYEDLSKDLPASIRKVADFLGKSLNQEQMDRLCDHLSIENFKNNKSVNFEDFRENGMLASSETFIRKGKTGGWREYFDEEMTQQAEQWIADNLRNSDLRYPNMDIKF
ncbi:uncharacterized protein LOC142987859 [Anticarsia gemmatalis]|uniref:uncharacterized protein LOC142987859 n=1 Tax=Anticarsia gemmatalis TaxID=129554 RepID=UPI003F759289